ncbi:hypothetical protein [Roseivirga seohaensis]|uniref:hypothetical protein n=1 Tax=Roseivirga seohaensis TaxID=1914963 RepID=UPI00069F534B|nr:hypothetical protein [Roseivirga seohaensis]
MGTFQNEEVAPGFSHFGLTANQTIAEIHSHVKTTTIADEKDGLYGDRRRIQGLTNRNGGIQPFNNYIYMKNSGRLWALSSFYSEGEYIRNIKGNYKRLFFGQLNSK